MAIYDTDEAENYQTEILNSLHLNGLSPHKLKLKVGSVVMLLRNIDLKRQLCNGTRLVGTELWRHNFLARRLVGTELWRHNFLARRLSGADYAQGKIILLTVSLTSGEEDDLPFRMKWIQFPVRLSFCYDNQQVLGSDVWLSRFAPAVAYLQPRTAVHCVFKSEGSAIRQSRHVPRLK